MAEIYNSQCIMHNAQLSGDSNFACKGRCPLGKSNKETTFDVKPQLLSFLKKKSINCPVNVTV